MIQMTPAHEECPYGASDCPKIETLRKMIEKNSKDLDSLNDNVVALTTTIRNASFFVGIIVTIGAAIIGVLVL